MVRKSALTACSKDFLYEIGNGMQNLLRLIPVRRMAALRQLQQFAGAADLPRDGIELRHGAVLVLLALDRQHRALDPRQILLDVPLADRRLQPGIGPEVECLARIPMVLAKALQQAA